MADSVSVTVLRKDGTIEEEKSLSTSAPQLPPTETEPSVTYEYFFSDWPGSEDALDLCQKYITEIEAIVFDGVANGFLTS